MFCSFYLILYIIWFHFSLSLRPFYYFDYYEHQYFTSVLFHMFSFIKNALFGSSSWMSHRTFIESQCSYEVTTAFWLDQYGGRFASIFRRCPPSMYWGLWGYPTDLNTWIAGSHGFQCVPPEIPRQSFYSSQNIGSTHWLLHMSVHEMQQVTGF